MGQHDAQFLASGGYPLPSFARIGYVVEVVHRQSAGYGLGVLAPSVGKGGVWREDGQPLLQLTFNGFELVLGKLATTALLQGIFYLDTGLRHLGRIECLGKQGGRTEAHLALDVLGYSKIHVY